MKAIQDAEEDRQAKEKEKQKQGIQQAAVKQAMELAKNHEEQKQQQQQQKIEEEEKHQKMLQMQQEESQRQEDAERLQKEKEEQAKQVWSEWVRTISQIEARITFQLIYISVILLTESRMCLDGVLFFY